MTTASACITSSKKPSRLMHAIWISAAIFFVACPDGEGALKSTPVRVVASWFVH
ncbi:MAG: hypothetical protein QM760_14085 [Nibricoccus sp.]